MESRPYPHKNMNAHIVLYLKENRVPRDAEKRIRAIAPERTLLITSDTEEVLRVLDTLEIAAGDFPHELACIAPRLAWFQQWYAGADWLQKYPQARELPFVLTNASGIHGAQMAEHFFGLLIAWYKKFPEVFAAQKRHEWIRRAVVSGGEPVAGKHILILGFGSIGREVARIAGAFRMKVTGVRRSPGGDAPLPGEPKIVGIEKLFEVLPEADVVLNILPYTPETGGLADKKFFAAMKNTALFANLGRGPTVNEDDLVAALHSGKPAGALLDVTAQEPLPPESPLWDAPGVILSPHYSGSHPRYDEIALELFLDNLRRYTKGEDLCNIVDKSLGY